MAVSAANKELLNYFMQLDEAEKESVLQLLKTFVNGKQQSAGRDTLEQYNKDIDEALAEAAAGNHISQEEMEKQAAKW